MAVVLREWSADATEGLREETRRALREGGLVGFPTETVYGIGGRYDLPATDGLLRVAKRCGPERPFQVLVASDQAVERFVAELPPVAHAFSERFWPGPLTIVAKSRRGDFVGLRWPAHEAAVFVVECAGGTLLSSSANRRGEPPARSGAEAIEIFDDRLTMAIDGGPEACGKASSVVRVTEQGWELLREEAVSRDDLTRAAGRSPSAAAQ